jgi:hypothetical protein
MLKARTTKWYNSREIQAAIILAIVTLIAGMLFPHKVEWVINLAPGSHLHIESEPQPAVLDTLTGKDSIPSPHLLPPKYESKPSVPLDSTDKDSISSLMPKGSLVPFMSTNRHTTALLAFGGSSENIKINELPVMTLLLLQSLFIGYILLWILRSKKSCFDPGVRQFVNYWIASWLVMFILYWERFIFQVIAFLDILIPVGTSIYLVDALIGNLVPALLFLVFFTLDVPSVKPANLPFRRYRQRIIFILLAVEFITVLALFTPDMRSISDWVRSIWAGLAIAFLAGKFESEVMRVPRLSIAVLYVYALIQMLSPILDTKYAVFPPWFHPVMYILALLGKITLFLIILYLIESRRIELYMLRLRAFD